MTRLAYIVTHPMSARYLMAGQLNYMRDRGYEVRLISSPGPDLDVVAERERVHVIPIPMAREIHPWRDLLSLLRLFMVLLRVRPHIVNAGTPKAGLLGMMAAWLSGVPVRVYHLRGLRLESEKGIKRFVLFIAEYVAAACAHEVIAVSHSLRDEYLKLGFTSPSKIRVLGNGSSNGVSVARFANQEEHASLLRQQLSIPGGVPVIGFVGRITADKGIIELCLAFEKILSEFQDARLLLVGALEKSDLPTDSCLRFIREHPQVIETGFVSDVAPYYALIDVLVIPSFREGFPNVSLEAACAGVPVVATRTTGCVDAVIDGVTGILVPIKDVRSLSDTIRSYMRDSDLRQRHGQAGRERARRSFDSKKIWRALADEYEHLLRSKNYAVADTIPKSKSHGTHS